MLGVAGAKRRSCPRGQPHGYVGSVRPPACPVRQAAPNNTNVWGQGKGWCRTSLHHRREALQPGRAVAEREPTWQQVDRASNDY